ncbi:hypothetical protein [Rheinheimera sp.]|nr:hypothetical protein [Rheinheimera sp.]
MSFIMVSALQCVSAVRDTTLARTSIKHWPASQISAGIGFD